MKLSILSAPKARYARLLTAAVALAMLCTAAPASAQLSRAGDTVVTLQPGGTPWRGVDTAYDPVHRAYLVVTGFLPLYGVFVNASNQAISPIFTISDGSGGYGHLPNVEYCPDVSNGAGGTGGFIVVWNNLGRTNGISGRIVSMDAPGYVVGAIQAISDPSQGVTFTENRPVIAYSRTSRRFLAAWTTSKPSFGIQGRFVGLDGVPEGNVIRFEEGGSRDAGLAWNPATDEFGMVNTGFGGNSAYTQFRRIRASDGAVLDRNTFGFSKVTFATGIDVNTSNQYVLVWALGPGTMSSTFNQNGDQLATTLVSLRFGFDLGLALAFNATSNTFLAVGQANDSYDVAAAEMAASGVPISSAQIVTAGASSKAGSFYPQVTARTGVSQWNVVHSRGFVAAMNQIVASGGAGSTTPTPPPPPPPTPTPTPTPSTCSTPDPFAAIGGGTCVNGGWRPGGSGGGGGGGTTPPAPTPTPTPTPTPSTCSTPDPFVSIGGGTCVNGGWRPGGGTPAPTPAPTPTPTPTPTPSTCTTPDPFASIGGGSCVNRGWVPASSAGGCVGSDPFVSIGGGVCISGGWVPRGR